MIRCCFSSPADQDWSSSYPSSVQSHSQSEASWILALTSCPESVPGPCDTYLHWFIPAIIPNACSSPNCLEPSWSPPVYLPLKKISQNHRIAKVGRELWKSSSPTLPHPLHPPWAGSATAGCPESCPPRFLISSRMEDPQPLKETCSSVQPKKVFIYV